MKRLAILGGGNMGEAILSGLLKSKKWKPSQIIVSDVRAENLSRLKEKYGIETAAQNVDAVKQADIILIAVKPQQISALISEIGLSVSARQLLITIAAGTPTAFIESFCPAKPPVIRVMPNTPALVGEGAAAVARGRWAGAMHEAEAIGIFSTIGLAVAVEEKNIDAVTAVSGSGPAYAFYLAEAMQEAGCALGLDPKISDQLVRQTMKGAGLLLSQSSDGAAVLRQKVTSPGGTTEAAINVLEAGGVKQKILEAVRKAKDRAEELSKRTNS